MRGCARLPPIPSNTPHQPPTNQQVASIRQLRSDKIGHLSAVAGTVTRTSDVRPELLVGAFKCRRCQTAHLGVEQQVGAVGVWCTYVYVGIDDSKESCAGRTDPLSLTPIKQTVHLHRAPQVHEPGVQGRDGPGRLGPRLRAEPLRRLAARARPGAFVGLLVCRWGPRHRSTNQTNAPPPRPDSLILTYIYTKPTKPKQKHANRRTPTRSPRAPCPAPWT